MQKLKNKRPQYVTLLLIWQIIEIAMLLFAFGFFYFFGVTWRTSLNSSVEPFIYNILAFAGAFLLIKIVVLIAMYKRKLWAVYFNLFQNIILVLLLFALFVISNDEISFGYYMIIFPLLIIGFIKAVRFYYYQKLEY